MADHMCADLVLDALNAAPGSSYCRCGSKTIINGNITINATGAIDKDTAEQIGLGIGKAAYSREGASR
jgi:hypothetical protein